MAWPTTIAPGAVVPASWYADVANGLQHWQGQVDANGQNLVNVNTLNVVTLNLTTLTPTTLKVSGNSGFGTATPYFKVHAIETTARTNVATFEISNADAALGFIYGVTLKNNNSTPGNYISLGNKTSGGADNAWIEFVNVDHSVPKGALSFSTRNGGDYNRRMHINEDGKVGINTLAPTARLHVCGLSSYANNAAAIAAGHTAGALYVVTGSNPAQVAIVT